MSMSVMQEWSNQIDCCPVMDDLLSAMVCCIYVQVKRPQNMTEMSSHPTQYGLTVQAIIWQSNEGNSTIS